MVAQFAKLLTSNDPPSEDAIREMKGIMAGPLEELEATDRKIMDLEEQLQILKEKREGIRTSVQEYRTILSPMRQLPNDILREIFSHCLPCHRNPVPIATEIPLLLAQVCSKWRAVVFSSPRLWSQLYISFCDEDREYRPAHTIDPLLGVTNDQRREKAIQVLNQRVEIVREWLARSGSCPLSISLNYTRSSFDWRDDVETDEDPDANSDILSDATRRLFKILASHSHHMQSLELSMPVEIYRELELMMSMDSLTALTELKVNFFYNFTPHGGDNQYEPIKLLKVPHLRRISLGPVDGYPTRRAWLLNDFPFADRGKQLTYFSSHRMFTLPESFSLLKQCENLVYCRLHLMSFRDSDDVPIQGVAYLPSLLSFALIDDAEIAQGSDHFFSSIEAPHLRHFDYMTQTCIHDTNVAVQTMHPVAKFLKRSPELRKLTIDPYGFSRDHLAQILQVASPSLEHLVLGQEVDLRTPKAQRGYFEGAAVSWDIGSLFTDEEGNSRPDILMPKLNILESSTGSISDSSLLRVITSRIEAASLGKCVPLKLVRVIFNKAKKVDIQKEVALHHERLGIQDGSAVEDFTLELEYDTDVDSFNADPLSSSFGIQNDRHWPHIELDEWVRISLLLMYILWKIMCSSFST